MTYFTAPASANQNFLASDVEDLSATVLSGRMGHVLGRPLRLNPAPASFSKLAAAMLGKQDVAQVTAPARVFAGGYCQAPALAGVGAADFAGLRFEADGGQCVPGTSPRMMQCARE